MSAFRPLIALSALALVGQLVLGCGPIEYLSQVTSRASTAVAQAKREGADVDAPYEFVAAEGYLEKAREEAARSEYQASLEYGRRSEELATKALAIHREKALRQRQRKPLHDLPSEAPTDDAARDDKDRR